MADREALAPEEPAQRSNVGRLAALAGALVPVILVVLYFLHSAGLMDLSEYSEILEAVEVEAVGPAEDLIRVYFTDPKYPDIKEDRRGGLDLILAADISEARSSIDVAAYDFDLESVARALVDAHVRGVKVRMVTDSDNAGESAVRQLKKEGIQIVEDEREALMHNKFVVIDEEVVWTGSWNLTENGTYRNNNNAVRIVSDLLAENYTVEFEEMFSDRQFGPESPSNTPHRQVTLKQGASDEGIRIESFFAPEDQVADMLLEQVKDANKSIRFMAFSFTDDRIGEEVKKKDKLGLKVQGVIEERGSETEHSEYGRFDRARPRLDVLLDGNPYMMHHKVVILDNKTVILGSYNFTRSASDFNDENILFIHDPEFAALFREEFDRVYKQAAAARE